jgi:transposase
LSAPRLVRQRFNVLGALNAITKQLITVTNNTYITSIQVCELLQLIAAQTIGPVTLVLDNARYQRCKLVMELADQLKIELLFLPPYSPNLNLIERLWKFTKKKCLNSRYHNDFCSFKQAICNLLSVMNKTHQQELDSLLALNFQVLDKKNIKNAI